jgi:transglutaminase-like putative cysteine protease
MQTFRRFLAVLMAAALGSVASPLLAGEPWDGPPFAGDPARILEAAKPAPGEEEAAAVVLLDEEFHSFDAGGRDTSRRRMVLRIVSPAGIDDWASLEETWSPWFEERPLLKARVITADGAVHALDPATITEGPLETSSKLYSDQKVVRAPLPALAVGAVVESETVVRERVPDFDAGRVFEYKPPVNDPLRRARLVVEAPPAIPLRHSSRLIPSLTVKRSEAGGLVRLTFECGPLEPFDEPESDLPPEAPQWPRVSFATGRSWKDVAARYGEIVESQIAGADLKKALEDALGESKDRTETVARVLAWIHRQVRYTGVELGEASIVPRRPGEVLERKYGDCKDQAALAIALLRAGNVTARAALLRMGPDPDIDPDLPGFDFDHVILYLPGPPEMWIDPTEEFARPGELPLEDQGRLALVVGPDSGAPRKTPEPTAEANSISAERELFLAAAGPARVVETIEARGSFELDERARYHETDRKTLREGLEKYLRKTYQARTLDRFEFSDPLDLSKPFQVRIEASAAANGQSDGKSATVTIKLDRITGELCSTVTGKGGDQDEAAGDGEEEPAAKKRANDYLMDPPHRKTWRYRITPPDGLAAEELPGREEVEMGPARLTKDYRLRPDGVVEATFTFDTVKARVSPAEFQALRAGIEALQKAEPVKIRFRAKGEK